jgi:hypothetical protein
MNTGNRRQIQQEEPKSRTQNLALAAFSLSSALGPLVFPTFHYSTIPVFSIGRRTYAKKPNPENS